MLSNTAILFFICACFTAVTLADDAVVVIKASDAVDVQALKNVAGTSAVYRVKRLNFYSNPVYQGRYDPRGEYMTTQWNYLVLGKGFTTKQAKTTFKNAVKALDFVEVACDISLTVNPHFNHEDMNDVMANASPSNFVERPMERGMDVACDKVTIDGIGDDGRALVIHFSKYGDERELKKYAGNLLRKVFPALGAKYLYSAVSSDGDFDAFTIMDYVNKATWCEYALSKWAKSNIPSFTKAFQAMAALSAVEV